MTSLLEELITIKIAEKKEKIIINVDETDKKEQKIGIRKKRFDRFPKKQSQGTKVSASDGPRPYQIKRWLVIINHWKRQNKIDKNSDDINQIIIDFISHSLYRLVKLPDTVRVLNAFGPDPPSTRRKKTETKPKLKSSVYWTEKEFIAEFVNNEELKEDETYKLFVKCLQGITPKINFEKECLLILHLEVPGAASIDLRTTLQTAYIRSGVIMFNIESRGWRKWHLCKYYVSCIVMSKALNIKTVEIDGCRSM
eukprot:UN05732